MYLYMIICIIGSGGREHAICKTISLSSKASKIYCLPGNAGTQQLAENIDLDIDDFEKVLKFLKQSKVDLVIVGPEKPLVNGVVDFLENNGIKVFGPRKIPSQLEGSKTFTKNICKKYNIPTAKFGIFEKKENTINFLKNSKFPIVIKADGLAAGKGVYISENLSEAIINYQNLMDNMYKTLRDGVNKRIDSVLKRMEYLGEDQSDALEAVRERMREKYMPRYRQGYFPHYVKDLNAPFMDGMMKHFDDLQRNVNSREKSKDKSVEELNAQLVSLVGENGAEMLISAFKSRRSISGPELA